MRWKQVSHSNAASVNSFTDSHSWIECRFILSFVPSFRWLFSFFLFGLFFLKANSPPTQEKWGFRWEEQQNRRLRNTAKKCNKKKITLAIFLLALLVSSRRFLAACLLLRIFASASERKFNKKFCSTSAAVVDLYFEIYFHHPEKNGNLEIISVRWKKGRQHFPLGFKFRSFEDHSL